MTDTVPLRDYSRSRAVLIGDWDYIHLTPVPAARNSLERVAGMLTGPLCGWPKQRVEVVRNVRRRDGLPDRLMELFADVADVAVFYFVGHGQLYEDELCLALRESPAAGPRRMTVGLPFSDVRAALRACDAQTKIVILDCCFAGHATRTDNSLASTPTNLIDKTLGTGAVTIAASGAYRTAWFESGPGVADPQTYFTKYLVDVIEQGIPGYPQGLPLGPVYARTADALARDRRPEPTRSVHHDADRFILARNAAVPTELPDALPGPPTTSPSGTWRTTPLAGPASPGLFPAGGAAATVATAHRGPGRRSLVLGGLGTLIAASGAVIALRLDTQSSSGGHNRRGVLSARMWFTLTDHSKGVAAAVFSPYGEFLAEAGQDHAVRLWDVATRKTSATFTGHTGPVNSVAFSPGGKTLVSAGDDGTVRLWNVAVAKNTATLVGHAGPVNSVTYSPDGKFVASAGDDGTVRLWNSAMHAVLTGHTGPVNSVACSPDGKFVASAGDDRTVRLWDVATRKPVATLTGHADAVMSIAFGPDGKVLAGAGDDGTVRLWDLATRKITATLGGHSGPVNSVAFGPDGKVLAGAGDDGTIRLWDLATRKITATLGGHSGPVNSVAFGPDGKVLAGAGDDGTIRLWELG